jgi:hypothetical protein
LVEASGSLESAWNRLDINNTGKVSRTAFDTGLSLLQVDVEQVCGVSLRKLFFRMARGGEVTQDAWSTFFRPLQEDPETVQALAEAADRFKQRVQQLEVNKQFQEQGRLSRRPSAEVAQKDVEAGDGTPETSAAGSIARVLVEICGSLDSAWQRLDRTKTGKVSRADFYLGLADLGLDTEQACGMPALTIFQLLSRAGEVTAESWGSFFRGAALRNSLSPLTERGSNEKDSSRLPLPAGRAATGLGSNGGTSNDRGEQQATLAPLATGASNSSRQVPAPAETF